MITGIVVFALLVVFILVAVNSPAVRGLWNRILVVAAFAWYVVIGWRLLTLVRG